jgi:hypothetical protein
MTILRHGVGGREKFPLNPCLKGETWGTRMLWFGLLKGKKQVLRFAQDDERAEKVPDHSAITGVSRVDLK